MHLFFIDQYISLDMMAPIMFKLSKKNKVFLCNFNKIQTFKHIKLYKFLARQKNIKIVNFTIYTFSKNSLYLFFLKCLLFLPSFFLKRGYGYWKYIWENKNFISKKKIVNFIRENNIKTISIDESLVEKKKYFLLEISNELNIPLLMNHGGLHTLKSVKNSGIKFKECTFYLSPNKFKFHNYRLIKSIFNLQKYIQFGSPRFDIIWLNILKKIYKKSNNKRNKKIKVALFVRPTSISYPLTLKLLENLKRIKNIEVKLNYKPRDVWPTKCSNINKNEMQSSELIIWSDIVISYASSIILEAICRDKPLIYLNYLKNDKTGDTWFDDLKFINKGKNIDTTLRILSNFKKNKKKLTMLRKNKKLILRKFITNSTGKGILKKYYFFYKKLSKDNQ